MRIQIKESFAESIEKIVHRNSWWYKTYELFRYDLPRFFKNIWKFRKALWNHYWFDHHGTLMFLETSLTHISDTVEKYGMEIDETRLKKVSSMRRAVQLIKNYNEDNYIDMAEKELGKLVLNGFEFEPAEQEGYFQLVDKDTPEEKEHNKKVFARAREIGEQEWNELFEILKGQDYSTFDTEKDWNKQFDGSGMRSWWD